MGTLTKDTVRRKKAVTDEVLIPADDEQARKLEEAESHYRTALKGAELALISGDAHAETSASLRVERSRLALEEAKQAVREEGLAFTLVGIGRLRWDELLREHPPTEEMKTADKDLEQKRTFNPDTFWPALLAECVRDSDMTADDWRTEVFESKDWGPQELSDLRDRAAAVNQRSRILELGN